MDEKVTVVTVYHNGKICRVEGIFSHPNVAREYINDTYGNGTWEGDEDRYTFPESWMGSSHMQVAQMTVDAKMKEW